MNFCRHTFLVHPCATVNGSVTFRSQSRFSGFPLLSLDH